MIRIRLLGTLALDRPDDTSVRSVLAQPKRFALLTYLAVAGSPASVRRDTLLALFWPELDDEHARVNLRQSLYRLRQSLGPGVVTGKGSELVGVDPERLWCDVAAFRRALEEGRPEDALELYRGPLLEGFHLSGARGFAQWLDAERRKLRLEAVTAAAGMAERAEGEGELHLARRWARRSVELAPYDEAIFRGYLRLLGRQGDRAMAVRAFGTFARRLSDDLDLEPSPRTCSLVEQIRRGPDPGEGPDEPGTEGAPSDRPGREPAARPPALSRPGPGSARGGPEPEPEREDAGAGPAVDSGRGKARNVEVRGGPRRRRRRIGYAASALLILGAGYLGFSHLHADEGGRDASEIRALAVLPLANRSGDAGQDYVAEGMTEALIAELGRMEELTVISRTSAMHYRDTERLLPDIAGELGVDAVIEGAVLPTGDDVGLALRLVDGRVDRQLWSGTYRVARDDLFELQRRVARAVAGKIGISLAPADRDRFAVPAPSPEPAAHEAYLKGRHFSERLGREALLTALTHFREAVALDPTFALAHAALAEACAMPALLGEVTTLPECRAAAMTAVELDDGLAEAHAALGFTRMLAWQWDASERAFRRALELNPGSVMARQWYAELLRRTMRQERALAEIRRAEELDPLNLFVKTMVGWALFSQRRYEEALAQWDEVLELDPDYGLALYNRGLAFWMMGRPDRVHETARAAGRRLGADAVVVRALEAAGHALAGDVARARSALSRAEGSPGREAPGILAAVNLALGDRDEALRRLERGHAARDPWLPNTLSEPLLDGLRDDPRFRELERSMARSPAADVAS